MNIIKLLEKIRDSEEYLNMNEIDQMIFETYSLIAEMVDLNHVYEYTGSKSWYHFIARHDVEHHIKMNYSPLDIPEVDIKFFWMDNGKASYSIPRHNDEKVYNTHMKILVDELLPYFEKVVSKYHNIDEVKFYATDHIRYRLYRMTFNKIIDKTKYDIQEVPDKNTLILKLKNFNNVNTKI